MARHTPIERYRNIGISAVSYTHLDVYKRQVWKGKDSNVALGQTRAIVVAVPAGTGAKLTTEVARPEPLVAPFAKGQQIGVLKISSAGHALTEVPLLALDGVEQAGILGRAWDALRLWIK